MCQVDGERGVGLPLRRGARQTNQSHKGREAFQGVSFHILLASMLQKIAISFGISPPLLIVFSEFADYI